MYSAELFLHILRQSSAPKASFNIPEDIYKTVEFLSQCFRLGRGFLNVAVVSNEIYKRRERELRKL